MPGFRKRFFENFTEESVPRAGRKGCRKVYTYRGNWYRWDATPTQLAGHKVAYVCCLVCGAAVYGLTSMQPAAANAYTLVAAPSLLSLVTLLYQALGVAEFCLAKEYMTVLDFEDLRKKLTAAPLLHALLLLVACGASCWAYLRVGGFSALIPAGYLVCAVLSGCIFFLHRRLKSQVLDNAAVPQKAKK